MTKTLPNFTTLTVEQIREALENAGYLENENIFSAHFERTRSTDVGYQFVYKIAYTDPGLPGGVDQGRVYVNVRGADGVVVAEF